MPMKYEDIKSEEDLENEFYITLQDMLSSNLIQKSKFASLNTIIDNSSLRCYDRNIELKMIKEIDKCNKKGDTIGGRIEVICSGLPYGLGSYTQWDKKLQPKR